MSFPKQTLSFQLQSEEGLMCSWTGAAASCLAVPTVYLASSKSCSSTPTILVAWSPGLCKLGLHSLSCRPLTEWTPSGHTEKAKLGEGQLWAGHLLGVGRDGGARSRREAAVPVPGFPPASVERGAVSAHRASRPGGWWAPPGPSSPVGTCARSPRPRVPGSGDTDLPAVSPGRSSTVSPRLWQWSPAAAH